MVVDKVQVRGVGKRSRKRCPAGCRRYRLETLEVSQVLKRKLGKSSAWKWSSRAKNVEGRAGSQGLSLEVYFLLGVRKKKQES